MDMEVVVCAYISPIHVSGARQIKPEGKPTDKHSVPLATWDANSISNQILAFCMTGCNKSLTGPERRFVDSL